MANSYSYDLRLKVMNYVEEGKYTKEEISKIFNIGRDTVYRWARKKKELGHFRAEENWRKGHSHKIKDLDKFREFVDHNRGKTLAELANLWGNIGKTAIQKAMKKIGYTVKKNNLWV